MIAWCSRARRRRADGPRPGSTLNACFRPNRGASPTEEAVLRAFDIAVTAFALRALEAKPEERERELVPAVDAPDTAMLDRAAISQERAALIASLWPAPTRQCVAAPVFEELPAPAIFGATYRVTLPGLPQLDARGLQQRLKAAFPPAEAGVQVRAKSRAA